MQQKRPSDTAATDPVGQQAMMQALSGQLDPWYRAVEHPASAQVQVLARYLADYARTDYGAAHDAPRVLERTAEAAPAGAGGLQPGDSGSTLVEAYRQAFPVMTYPEYKPLITTVLSGDTKALLCEEPLGWAITRGTTADEPKFIPMTPTDIKLRVSAGRAMMAYVAATKRLDLFAGVNLNLNFPSVVGTVKVGDRQIEYGYSSGIYTKFVSKSHAHPLGTIAGGHRRPRRRHQPRRLGCPLRAGPRAVPGPERHPGGRSLPDRPRVRPLSAPGVTRCIPSSSGRPR